MPLPCTMAPIQIGLNSVGAACPFALISFALPVYRGMNVFVDVPPTVKWLRLEKKSVALCLADILFGDRVALICCPDHKHGGTQLHHHRAVRLLQAQMSKFAHTPSEVNYMLNPKFCIGETRDQRFQGRTFSSTLKLLGGTPMLSS